MTTSAFTRPLRSSIPTTMVFAIAPTGLPLNPVPLGLLGLVHVLQLAADESFIHLDRTAVIA